MIGIQPTDWAWVKTLNLNTCPDSMAAGYGYECMKEILQELWVGHGLGVAEDSMKMLSEYFDTLQRQIRHS